MNAVNFRDISINGLWRNNPALVQLLGLCPLLGVSNSAVNALGLGLATIGVLGLSNTMVSLVRNQIPDTVRLPVFVIIIASFTTCIELLMQAYTYQLYQVLGIFIPIIVTNCAILGRAEGFARKNLPLPALWDGLMMGMGFALALLALGVLRELLGSGAVFADMQLLFGETAQDWKITLVADYQPMLVAVLPPGAFILAGLLIAMKNFIDNLVAMRRASQADQMIAGSKRVRVTGKIA